MQGLYLFVQRLQARIISDRGVAASQSCFSIKLRGHHLLDELFAVVVARHCSFELNRFRDINDHDEVCEGALTRFEQQRR